MRDRRVQVVASVIRRDDSYLICQRPPEKRHGGLWEFPGGKLLDGESPFQGARRELREELDLEVVAVGEPLLKVHDPGSEFEILFCPVAVRGEPQALEHTEICWVSREHLRDYTLAPSDLQFAETIVS